eukprot:13556385-Alexandrium_andersonii.AAC.1
MALRRIERQRWRCGAPAGGHCLALRLVPRRQPARSDGLRHDGSNEGPQALLGSPQAEPLAIDARANNSEVGSMWLSSSFVSSCGRKDAQVESHGAGASLSLLWRIGSRQRCAYWLLASVVAWARSRA